MTPSAGKPIPASWVIVWAAVLGTALAYMSDDMLNLAVPSVAHDLGATMTDVQWILNAYYVPLVAGTLVAGGLGDHIGHRRVFVAGIWVFAVGAIGCAMAPSVAWLVAGRGVQGVGAAMLLAGGLALVARHSTAEARTGSVARFLGMVAAVPALGPFVSGALVDLVTWRWLFVVPLVLPAAALALVRLGVPETPRSGGGARLDVAGAATLTLTLGALAIVLVQGAAGGSPSVMLVGGAVIAVAGLAFVRIERRAGDPLLPLDLLRRPRFAGGNLVWLIGCMTSWGAVFFVAVMLQAVLGLAPVLAGLLLTPIYLVMMAGSPLAGTLAERRGHALPILLGLAVYVVGLLVLATLGPGSRIFPDVVLAIGVFAVGMALFSAPLAAATMSALDDSEQGVASGVNNAAGQLAGLLAIVVLPALAGLGGVALDDPAFAAGYSRALLACAALAGIGFVLAAWVLTRRAASRASLPRLADR